MAAVPWVWVLPFPFLFDNAEWSDVLVAAAAAAWLWDQRRRPLRPRLRAPHVFIAVYLAASGLSLAVSPARHRGAFLLLGMCSLGALFVLTSELTREPAVRRALVRVLVVTAFLLGLATVVGLALFFAGHSTRLLGSYGDLVASSRYARVEAGFENPNLLASFCTFASAVVARDDADLPVRVRRVAQTVLCVVVLFTFSRALLGFVLAMGIRLAAGRRRGGLAVAVLAAGVAGAIAVLTFANLSFDPGDPGAVHFSAEPSTRRQTLVASLHTLAAHPVLGQGLGSLPGGWDGGKGQAHMTVVEVAATQGPFALAGLAALVVTLWRRRRRPTDLATWSALAAMALDSLSMDIHRFRHLWVLFGLADADREDGGARPG